MRPWHKSTSEQKKHAGLCPRGSKPPQQPRTGGRFRSCGLDAESLCIIGFLSLLAAFEIINSGRPAGIVPWVSRQHGRRFRLLIYERMWQRWTFPCLSIALASAAKWLAAPSMDLFPLQWRVLTPIPGICALVHSRLRIRGPEDSLGAVQTSASVRPGFDYVADHPI